MEERNYGENTSLETRKESYDKVDKNKRYFQIKGILKEYGSLTAKQIAILMNKRGFTNNDDRNNSAPRLTELCIAGEIEIIGKVKCEYTGKTVSVYKLREV
jgi:hypothetical protein